MTHKTNDTFAHKVKSELIAAKCDSLCCKRSLLYGMLLCSNVFEEQQIRFVSENESAVQTARLLLQTLLPDVPVEYTAPHGTDAEHTLSRLSVTGPDNCGRILRLFAGQESDQAYPINMDLIHACPSCPTAFLRGAFLAAGNITSPKKEYHLEIDLAQLSLTHGLLTLLEQAGFEGKYSKRKSRYVLYYKGGDTIFDLLCYLGANNAAFEFLNTKIEKEIRNTCNRMTNCETANIQKAIEASALQVEAIQSLRRTGQYDALPDKLKETAEIRLKNPGLPLAELAAAHQPSVTKSCAGHRLKKLIDLSKLSSKHITTVKKGNKDSLT